MYPTDSGVMPLRAPYFVTPFLGDVSFSIDHSALTGWCYQDCSTSVSIERVTFVTNFDTVQKVVASSLVKK